MNLLTQISQDHFAQNRSNGNLVTELRTRLASGPIEDVFAILDSGVRVAQRCAFSILRKRIDELTPDHVRDAVAHQRCGTLQAFCGLRDCAAMLRPHCDQLALLVASDDSTVRQPAAELICRFFDHTVQKLVPMLIADVNLSKIVCLHAPDTVLDALIERHLEAVKHGLRIAPLAGVALNPERLLKIAEKNIGSAATIAREFGYIESDLSTECLNQFQAGFWFSDRAIGNDVEECQRGIDAICWYLIGRSHCYESLKVPEFDAASSRDQARLIAAARKLDADNLQIRRKTAPFEHTDLLRGALTFAHSPYRLVRAQLFDEAIANADDMKLPSEFRNQFVLDWASMLLTPDLDQRTECRLFLHARYGLAARFGAAPHDRISDSNSRRLPEATSLVVSRDVQKLPPASDLSPGAQATRQFAWTFLGEDLTQTLSQSENAGRTKLLPIGIEVQIPKVPLPLHIAWKEAFRAAGIPSPRRPECRSMLEAAFPPSATAHAPVEFLRCMEQVGMLTEAQDLGIHISFQGNLGNAVRYLAFVQLFLNSPVARTPRPPSAQRLVMSKGLICLNSDITRCSWKPDATQRTELRTFIIAANASDTGAIVLDRAAIAAIHETHLLASAMVSPQQSAQDIYQSFVDSVESILNDAPKELRELLACNFFEATGDYRDANLLEELPIVRARAAARACIQDADFIDGLRAKLADCRQQHTELVANAFGVAGTGSTRSD